jgi:hypothetical protein
MWPPGFGVMLGITVVLVVLSVLGIFALEHYRRYRGTKWIHCPETGGWVNIRLDTGHAVCTSLLGSPQLRVTHCSRWPERHMCDQDCRWAAQNQLTLHTVSDAVKPS